MSVRFTEKDIKRLNQIKYSTEMLVVNPPSLFYCILKTILRFPGYALKGKFGQNKIKDLLIVSPTINNKKSFEPVLQNLDRESYTLWDSLVDALNYVKITGYSIIGLPLFLKLYFGSAKKERELIRFYYFDFITAYGTYKVIDKFLNKNSNIKLILFANDHLLVNRCLIELSPKYQIKTLYIQHASVNKNFPPLGFDYSFLDGMESLEIYKSIGEIRGKVFLSGSPRFDVFSTYKNSQKHYDVGVALNELDLEDMALDLCLYIKKNYSERIIVRPHPGMLRGNNLLFHEDKFLRQGIAISNPKQDMSNVFLSEINRMIANESGIHLDAALMGVPSMLYNFSNNEVYDWYSFIKMGLVPLCSSKDDVLKLLNSGYSLPVDVVRYYAASFMSPMDGNVGKMIASFTSLIINQTEEDATWFINKIMIEKGGYAEYRY